MITSSALYRLLAAWSRFTALASIVAITGSAGPASAQPAPSGLQSYEVELVIFRVVSPQATPEQWSMEAEAAGEQAVIEDEEPNPFTTAPAPAASMATFPALAHTRLKLSGIDEVLRRSRKYQPIAHIGWTQPGYPRDTARFLPINSLVPASSGLTGQIALTRGRYLHLTLDLAYEPPAADGSAPQRYVLRQTRRMRSHERHYIDHPMFGVIALVTPIGG